MLVATYQEVTQFQLLSLAHNQEEQDFALNAHEPDASKGIVMTDNFAPIERLAGANL